MGNRYPVISCVCITRGKPSMLGRAIACFIAQTYPCKELIVVYEDDDVATTNYVHTIASREKIIRFISVCAIPKHTLGELRNISIDSAAGTFICQWDDDDWYHTNRLMLQYENLMINNRNGSVLTQWIVYNAIDKKAYVSNRRIWEGSILCRKSVLQRTPYELKHIGEDTATVAYLMENKALCCINDDAGLYIYIYHGTNTWNHDHWNYIFKCSDQLPAKDSLKISLILEGHYTPTTGAALVDGIMQRYYAHKSISDIIVTP